MKRKKYVISLFLLVMSTTAIYGAEQKIAVPSYFYPGSLWDKLESGYPTVQIGIINPNSGAGSSSNPDYVQQVQNSQQLGITIIGYIYTSYGSRSLNTVKNYINKYYNWYNVDGIFIDETSTSCNAISYYINLYNYIKGKGGTVIINPGIQTNECYVDVADIILSYENVYSQYVSNYNQPSWVSNYPASKFWHLVHQTPNISSMENAIDLSKQRNAGWIYVTSDTLPNPWDTLPSDAYWNREIELAGENDNPPEDPSDNRQIFFDNFESGWGNWNDGGADSSRNGSSQINGRRTINLQDNSNPPTSTTYSDVFDASGYTAIRVVFDYKVVSFESNEYFALEYYQDNSGWSVVKTWVVGRDFNNGEIHYSEEIVILGDEVGLLTSNARIRFRSVASGDNDDLYLDNIYVEGVTE
jgi:hypothetical protein